MSILPTYRYYCYLCRVQCIIYTITERGFSRNDSWETLAKLVGQHNDPGVDRMDQGSQHNDPGVDRKH